MDILLADSDWSESGSEEQEFDFLYSSQAQIILSRLEKSISKIDDFLSFKREFAYGDIVCSVTDRAGQTGRVINIDMFVDLENVHGKEIKDVNSKKLLKIRSFSVGDYVVHKTWIGRVEKVVDCLSIVFDDGSKCEMTVVDPEKVVPISPNLLEDSEYFYYPGQRVHVLPNVSKSARCLCSNWSRNQDEGTVSGVDAGLVYVDWIASARIGCDISASPPPCLQDPNNLTLLSCFSHANWQLGDWCILPLADCKGIMEQVFLCAPVNSIVNDQNKMERGFKRGNVGSKLEEIFTIVKTRTKVDVAWQDGSCNLGLDSQNLLPVDVVNPHEFWPGQFVLEKGTCENSKRWGVVWRVDAKERTVRVHWRNSFVNETKGFDGKQEETVSAFELVEHPDYSFCFGDVVLRVAEGDLGDQAAKGHVISETGLDAEATFKGKICGSNHNGCPSMCYLSCIGTITGFEDGNVEVKWATGFSTKVAPYEIYRVEKNEGSATKPVLLEENFDELNQQTIAREKQYCSQKEKNLVNHEAAGENSKKNSWGSYSFSLAQVAIGFFTRIASSLLGTLCSTSGHISADRKEYEILFEKETLEACNLCVEPDPCDSKQEVEENGEKKYIVFSREGENTDRFRQFDIVSDCSDHHFLGERKVLLPSQMKRSWLKKVREEWSILEKTLPETVYVRIYEERMDLLRAAFVGASGTPYHDGLFFFDIFLPPEYPSKPPLVYYNSGGLRLNPNLYESGKICLSLLNTWTGSGTEVWNPDCTILQVLLSLQALVLSEKPYFNEAGYDKQIGRAEGEKNSVNFNENAFLLNCKSMLYILHNPPKHFEALVKEHFSERSSFILSACKAYMEGALVGRALEHGNSKGSSTGFKITLAKLFPKLVEAFSAEGIDCSQFTKPEK